MGLNPITYAGVMYDVIDVVHILTEPVYVVPGIDGSQPYHLRWRHVSYQVGGRE